MRGSSTRFAISVRRSRRRTFYYDPALPEDLRETLWERPAALADTGQPLQQKPIRRTVLIEWRSRRYVLKQYVEASFGQTLKHSLEPATRAWRSWSATRRLSEAGIPTPRSVACVESRWGRLRRDSFMMYPYVEGRTLKSLFESPAADWNQPDVWRQLGEIWERLAEMRISLSDTNVRNFILCPRGKVWVIDLDKTRRHWSAVRAARYHRRSWKRLTVSVALAQRRAA